MKRLCLYVINSIPSLVISYRPSMFWDGTPIGPCDYERTYHKLTHATLTRLVRHADSLNRHIYYAIEPKTGTDISILEITLNGGAK